MLEHIFAYTIVMVQEHSPQHSAVQWKLDARQPGQPLQMRLRLTAMAGHMRVDKVAARRAASIDLLTDGHPHGRQEI